MEKPDTLRRVLLAHVPQLGADPSKLSLFVDKGRVAAPFFRATATRGLDQHLAHRPRRDPLEMQRRRDDDAGGRAKLEPRFVDEGRGAERRARIVASHGSGEAAQLFIRRTEQLVERPGIGDDPREVLSVLLVLHLSSPQVTMTVFGRRLRNVGCQPPWPAIGYQPLSGFANSTA